MSEEQSKLHHVVMMEKLDKLERKITIVSDNEIVSVAKKRACELVGKQVIIKGFRKGKAPSHLIDLYYPKDVKGAMSSILSQEAFLYACFEQKITPLGEPKVEKADFNDDDGTFLCEITVEIRPEITPSGYVGLRLKQPNINKDDMFEHIFEEIKSQHMIETQVKEITLGSVATVNFWVFVDGKEITSGDGHNFLISEGQEPPFGENLIGMKCGEMRTENIIMPQGPYKGKNAEVKIELIFVIERREPTNEELVEKMKAPSYEDLMNLIREDAEQRTRNKERQSLEEQIVDNLVETHEFEVPEKWVIDEESYALKQLNVSDPDEETKKQVKLMAERNVRRSFLLEAIYAAENMQVKQEELDLVIKTEAERLGVSRLVLKDHIKKEGLTDGVIAAIKQRKVFDFILNQAQIENTDGLTESCEIPENPLG